MAPREKKNVSSRRATTLEGREQEMVSLAVNLAERQLKEGTASAQVISHYLKLGSTREILEQQKMERENELLRARVEQLASSQRTELLYDEAIKAMRRYAGQEDDGDSYDDY
jgi:hypothetical protein